MGNTFQSEILNGFDKQIYFVKIIIGEGCPLRCHYCFVDKDNGRVISEENIFRLIDLLLFSPGRNKLLHLLGGEPLLHFDLITRAIRYARDIEKSLGKQLDISFCTSGVFFDKEKLKIIGENDIYLAWSIDGPRHIHDRNRVLGNGNGSYDKVIVKKDIVIDHINPKYLGIAITVDINTVDELFDSYKHLVDKLGFNCTVNVAPVDGKLWPKEKQKIFIDELTKIHDYIFDEIGKGRYMYLNSMNKEFRFNMLSVFRKKGGRCLWFYTEALTNGDVLFNPFVNKEEDYSRYVVGNIGDENFLDKVDKYIGCVFDSDSDQCNNCRDKYFEDMNMELQDIQMNNLLKYRDRVSVLYTQKIRAQSKNNLFYKEYIELAKDYMYV